ncbi:Hypothetical predicted protein [Lecanosticta acicola]|uniref:N-acetylglucosamine-induced protein 1 n=1 Tax=Lecanosticta acicola TaxID=111012 RepID=A0AAI8Z8K0_9PEZI|nr:Hypothetical predicted protein [Lecanosticta acicola]
MPSLINSPGKATRELGEKHRDKGTVIADGTQLVTRLELDDDAEAKCKDFWNVNVPASEQTKDCPDFLKYALENEKDREILSTPDDQYRRQRWPEVQQLIRDNRLDLFTRVPSELRLYRQYCAKLIQDYGSIMKFVVQERLHWEHMASSSAPFSDPSEYKILYNDWPYGVDERIVHLVVWTKFELPADPRSELGDMSPETRQLVNDWVNETFTSKCGQENVIWFKNWAGLKSIHAVEHFHVMLFNPDMDFVREITNDDVPLFLKVKRAKVVPR